MEIWLIDRSRKRIYRLTPQEVDALCALKLKCASEEQKALCLLVGARIGRRSAR